MSALGMIGRHDAGGLGTLTREVFRHMKPERTLLLELGGAGRFGGAPHAYDIPLGTGRAVYPAEWQGGLAARHIEWLCAEGIDTLWTAETFYDDEVVREAHRHGIRTILYGMPELTPIDIEPRPRVFRWPTEYYRTRELYDVLPFPVARDRLPWTERGAHDNPLHLFHTVGAAMLDRNGTTLLMDALSFVRRPIRVTIRDEKCKLGALDPYARAVNPSGAYSALVDATVTHESTPDYWDAYPKDIDLLVQPRRYGGLSLPIQECASLGVPTLLLANDPYAGTGFTYMVPSRPGPRDARMKGGLFLVYDADPRSIAQHLDHLSEHRNLMVTASREADAWADAHDWAGELGRGWERLLRGD